jgi:hypothetical protein
MRLVCAFVFAVFLALLPASLEAKFVCGNFDGTFSCRRESAPPKVKGAIPTARPKQDASPDAAAPAPGTWSSETSPSGAPASDGTACHGGMVGTRPIAAARRARNCWAAIASATPRRHAAMG